MSVFYNHPHPRVLFEDVPDELFEELAPRVPHAVRVESFDPVHEPEFDLLVTFASDAGRRSKHLHILSFGAMTTDSVDIKSAGSTHYRTMSMRYETHASLVSVDASQERSIRKLAEHTVAPLVQPGLKQTWGYNNPWSGDVVTGDLSGQCRPIISVGEEGFVLALARRRVNNDSGGWSWLLPEFTRDHAAWLQVFLKFLHSVDEEHFAGELDWRESNAWSTREVRVAAYEADDHRDNWRKQAEAYELKDVALQQQLAAKRAEAAANEQRLLTSLGEELETAVEAALVSFGFDVRNMDDHHDEKSGGRLEDLRVCDHSRPGWVVLVEVKGYTRGVKANDVAQILSRPVISYVKETGNEPDAVWHIVNGNRQDDPSIRPQALPNDTDIAALGQQNGLLIDTRELFTALQKIADGDLTAAAVRASLTSPPIRWTCP